MEKTKYRIVGDGYRYFLQYRRKVKFLSIFYVKFWANVPQPFFDKQYGLRLDIQGWESNLTASTPRKLESFIKETPYIDEYLEWVADQQEELEDKHEEYHREVDAERAAIKNFSKEF